MGLTQLPAIGLGCASLGRPETPEDEAQATLRLALEAGISYLDTAPLYGCGLSERRVGRALADWSGPRPTLSSKAGYIIDVPEGSYLPADRRRTDHSRDGIRRSVATSLDRLGVDRLDLVYVHGPDDIPDQGEQACRALADLRDEGVVGAIGVGTNQIETALGLMERCRLDAVLIAGRLTLLDRSAEAQLIETCARKDVALVVGGVFNSGILAADDPRRSSFDYAPAQPRQIAATREMAALCARHDVSLKAAALRFVAGHRGVTSTLLGAARRQELRECLLGLETPVPEKLWSELDAAARAHAF